MPPGAEGPIQRADEDDSGDDNVSLSSKPSRTASELRAMIVTELTNMLGRCNNSFSFN